jgi:hypothetical protein
MKMQMVDWRGISSFPNHTSLSKGMIDVLLAKEPLAVHLSGYLENNPVSEPFPRICPSIAFLISFRVTGARNARMLSRA